MAKTNTNTNLKVALVGGETLLGKEVAEVLESRLAGATLLSFAATGEGNFGEAEGEAVYIEPLEERTVGDARAVVVAGSLAGAQKTYDLAKAAGGHPPVIDCTGQLEHQPEARIVAPLVTDFNAANNWLFIVAHPAASALAVSLRRLAQYRKIRQVLAHIFEPASEQGRRGISELHEQTTSLLSFKPPKKELFDAQLSFNMLSRFGEDAPQKLSAVEQRIERDLATVFSTERSLKSVPMPSLRVIAAPVFHGYSISLWVEFETAIDAQEVGEALASAQIEVRDSSVEPPDNVGAANQSGLVAGDIRVDRNNGRAAWIWMVGDNLRLTADATADLLARLKEQRP